MVMIRNLTGLTTFRALAASSLLLGLIVLSGCAGSSLGDRVGKSLEPDPQLAERNNNNTDGSSAATDSSTTDSPKVTVKPATDTSGSDSTATDSGNSNTPAAQSDQNSATSQPATASGYTDLDKAPEELRPYLVDLLNLKLLAVRSPTAKPATGGTTAGATPSPPPKPDEFRPNQATTRREYARWLLAVNNRLYQSTPSRKIRAGVTSSQPVFQDVPVSDPDFAAIQGLAEAGIIPSPLTGSSTTLTLRPDAPLTRKDLLLWKVPLDTRQPLPDATTAAVKQAWGFQDADKIDPRVSQALIADYQQGDFSNIRRAFGYTTLFQPDKAATRAEAAAVLWRFGNSTEGITAAEILNPTAPAPNTDTQGND
ncbi:MAG: S-layer protein [Phormidesmis sp.]